LIFPNGRWRLVQARAERQGHLDPGSAAWTFKEADLAVVGEDDLARDGQAQAGRAGTTFAAGIQAHEPVEDAAAVGGGDARAVVVDLDPRDEAVGFRRDDHAAGRVSQRVVDDVAEEPLQMAGVAGDSETRPGAQVDRRLVGGQARHGTAEHGRQVDGFPPRRKLPFVRLGEQQELLSERFQAC
jgi:hypothetical protein